VQLHRELCESQSHADATSQSNFLLTANTPSNGSEVTNAAGANVATVSDEASLEVEASTPTAERRR
jgi:hypothetical protein